MRAGGAGGYVEARRCRAARGAADAVRPRRRPAARCRAARGAADAVCAGWRPSTRCGAADAGAHRDRPRRTRRGSALLALLLLVATPLSAQSAVGERATPITVLDLDQKPVRLDARAAGRPLLIEFWATWCEVCEALMPGVRAAHARYGTRVDFVGVNVTINESRSRVRRWVERERPPYRTLYDESGLAVRTFGAPVTSYVVIIDATGVIRYTGVGEDQDLMKILGEVVP